MSLSRSIVFAACQTCVLLMFCLVHVNILFAQAEGHSSTALFPPPPDDWREIAEEVAKSGEGQAGPDDGGFPGAVLELMATGPQLPGFNEQSELLALNKRIVASDSYSHWQESVYDEGNFRVLLPGAGFFRRSINQRHSGHRGFIAVNTP